MSNERSVFFVSDRTGITAETLGHSLLTQFDRTRFNLITLPFINSVDKAKAAVARIDKAAESEGRRCLVFSTMVDDELKAILKQCACLFLDFFDAFIGPIERELDTKSSHASGRAHGSADEPSYLSRIDALNFVLANDDGVTTRHYDHADIVLVGVSRSGKTPTCLYMALQYGVFAANYPLVEDDFEANRLPQALRPFHAKLYGLTIDPVRLQQIRSGRRPNSRYASLRQARYEVAAAETIFRAAQVPFYDTTHPSIEEIATTILHETGIKRRFG
jgi:regulator of PEP synthase PpsR (kinase-PPPase family)